MYHEDETEEGSASRAQTASVRSQVAEFAPARHHGIRTGTRGLPKQPHWIYRLLSARSLALAFGCRDSRDRQNSFLMKVP
jgi:hypothetical protein